MDIFSRKNILKVYKNLKKGKLNTGLDRISRKNFDSNTNDHIDIIERKINNSTYEFTPFKEILLLKGKGKIPRILSIPTIRDKIVLKILGNELKKIWGKSSQLQETVKSISNQIKSGKYKYYLKMDISGYYSSIPHKELTNILADKIKDTKVLELIVKAIKTHTYATSSSKEYRDFSDIEKGIPQGISISNALGFAYLKEFDTYNRRKRKYEYYRYVDDILILCLDDISGLKIQQTIKDKLKMNYQLTLEPDKEDKNSIANGITFLGYKFNHDGSIEISKKNIMRLESNIEIILHDFINSKDKRVKNNIELLKWKINLKISGLIKNNKTYGWVYYFRLNENVALMHRLDSILVRMIKRFKLEKKLLTSNGKYNGKKFVTMFYEIKNKGNLTRKIMNVDTLTVQQKRDVLRTVCQRKLDSSPDYYIDIEFNKFIFKSISEIEFDLQQQYMI